MSQRAQLGYGSLNDGMAIVGRLKFLWLSITNDHRVLNLQFRVNVSFLV